MLTRKKITLLTAEADLAPLITRAQLREQQQGQDILIRAEQQAALMLAAAQQDADACRQRARQQAEQAFWQQASALLADWQQHYQQTEQAVLAVMDSVLAQALTQLLAEVPQAQRLNALLRQLLQDNAARETGTLYCALSQQAQLADWLAQHPHLRWRLQPDDGLAINSLKLVTAQGELQLDWQQAVQQLLPPEAES